MKDKILSFDDTQLTFPSKIGDGLEYVMMDWETPLMEAHSKLVCHNKGDVLEFGFGMGISATFIQSHKPKSHTIIEIHPQVAQKAREWAQDKTGVKIIEGDWYECLDQLGKYDGIFFDTYGDPNYLKFGEVVKSLTKPGSYVTWWNAIPQEKNVYGIEGVVYTKYEVDPPQNNYFNHKEYYLPLKIY